MTFPGRFAGKVAVVTGAAQGIGREVALRLAAEGARVVLADRSELVHEVQAEAGPDSLAVTGDLEHYAGAMVLMESAVARFGRLDVLVNNVGGTIWAKPYAEYEPAQIEAEVQAIPVPDAVVLPGCAAAYAGGRGRGASSTCPRWRRGESTGCRIPRRRAA